MAKLDAVQFGKEMTDFVVGVSDAGYTALEFQAKVQGFKSVNEMLETQVFPYTPKTVDVIEGYVIPKRHSGISFCEETNGEVFKFNVTRVAERQSAIMEVQANAQLLIAGFTKLTVDTNGIAGTQVEVAMPLLRKFSVIPS